MVLVFGEGEFEPKNAEMGKNVLGERIAPSPVWKVHWQIYRSFFSSPLGMEGGRQRFWCFMEKSCIREPL